MRGDLESKPQFHGRRPCPRFNHHEALAITRKSRWESAAGSQELEASGLSNPSPEVHARFSKQLRSECLGIQPIEVNFRRFRRGEPRVWSSFPTPVVLPFARLYFPARSNR